MDEEGVHFVVELTIETDLTNIPLVVSGKTVTIDGVRFHSPCVLQRARPKVRDKNGVFEAVFKKKVASEVADSQKSKPTDVESHRGESR